VVNLPSAQGLAVLPMTGDRDRLDCMARAAAVSGDARMAHHSQRSGWVRAMGAAVAWRSGNVSHYHGRRAALRGGR